MSLSVRKWLTDKLTSSGWGRKWSVANDQFPVCPCTHLFSDYLRVWVEIEELESVAWVSIKKETKTGKAIFSQFSKVCCVMQLVMTTKLMVPLVSPRGISMNQTHELKTILFSKLLPVRVRRILISLLKAKQINLFIMCLHWTWFSGNVLLIQSNMNSNSLLYTTLEFYLINQHKDGSNSENKLFY